MKTYLLIGQQKIIWAKRCTDIENAVRECINDLGHMPARTKLMDKDHLSRTLNPSPTYHLPAHITHSMSNNQFYVVVPDLLELSCYGPDLSVLVDECEIALYYTHNKPLPEYDFNHIVRKNPYKNRFTGGFWTQLIPTQPIQRYQRMPIHELQLILSTSETLSGAMVKLGLLVNKFSHRTFKVYCVENKLNLQHLRPGPIFESEEYDKFYNVCLADVHIDDKDIWKTSIERASWL